MQQQCDFAQHTLPPSSGIVVSCGMKHPIHRIQGHSEYEKRYGFCRALRVGNVIEVAGTAPIPQDGSETPASAYDQARLCFDIATDAVRELGGISSLPIRTRMYICDASDQDEVGQAHGDAFAENPPVATMVVVAGLLDPRWKVEIELTALVPKT